EKLPRQPQDIAVCDPLPDACHELGMRDVVVETFEITLDYIAGARIGPDHVSQSGMGRMPLTESMRAGQEIRFKDRFEHHAEGLLYDPILDRVDAQWASF